MSDVLIEHKGRLTVTDLRESSRRVDVKPGELDTYLHKITDCIQRSLFVCDRSIQG